MLKLIKNLTFIVFVCLSLSAKARETIIILNPLSPSHSGTPHVMAMIDTANRMQNKYQFIQEFRVGGFESIALKHVLTDPNKYLAMITNTTAEAVDRKFTDLNNYVPVFSQGDSCWMVIALVGPNGKDLNDIRNLKEIVVGTPALGGATHIAALEIGKKYNIPVRYILFQSNFDAFTNMASNNGVTFGVERVVNFKHYQDKNPNMKMLAAHCPTRYPGLPNIKTTTEQGISAPFIWQQIVSAKDMDPQRRKEIADIFTQAERQLGQQEIFKISDQIPPMFHGVSTEQHYNDSWNKLKYYRAKWQESFRNQ